MKTTLQQVKIVEYHEGLAKGIAKMWNESRENWGGDSTVTTEQDVKDKEESSTNLHLFLAMVGDEVAGYCGLSEYREDVGALYIPLLNVHPKYQGLKIGKQLVLKAIEKTVELQWPRLDLFTWPGNTKAVPLYKKCGFFWEDRDDTVHLMNFIPMVLQLDLLKPFFEKHDWYQTSQRLIEVKPDALKVNEHTYYEYKWEADGEFVRIQFERTGRGIRLIETQDYLVQMNIPEFKLLENEYHYVNYHVENRSKEPIEVSIKGVSSTIAEHVFEDTFQVENKWIRDYTAKVSMPQSEPGPWKTHPTIGAEIKINNQALSLKMGVYPKQAGKVNVRSVKKNWRPHSKGIVYLDLESQVGEDTTWTVKLPENKVISWEEPEVNEEIHAKGRVSIPIPVQLLKNGFLSEEIVVEVKRENGHLSTFKTTLKFAFPGFGAKFGGETDEHWFGYNGPHYVEIEKRNHMVKIGSAAFTRDPISFFTPKLGKPYSEEFSKKEASSIEFIELPEALVVKTSLISEAFPAVLLNSYFKIYGEGLVEVKHEVVNTGDQEKKNLSLIQPVFTSLEGLSVPQNEGVLKCNESLVPFVEYIDDKAISERWMFLEASIGDTIGLSWPENAIARKDDWRMGLEYDMDLIPAHEELCLGPIQVGINTSKHWSKWREFIVGDETERKELPLYTFGKANGDVVSTIGAIEDYSFNSMMTPYIQGTLTVGYEGGTLVKEVLKDDALTQVTVEVEHNSPGVKWISGDFSSNSQTARVDSLQFVKGKSAVKIGQHDDIWSVDNGVVSFKASSDYYPGIYSLRMNGREALDHQYPTPGPRAWWNPWGGGIAYSFRNISAYSMLKEKTTIESVTKVDHNGHRWSGLCLTTEFKQHEKMKGVILRQYALTLPEVPVFTVYAEIHQHSGQTIEKELLDLDAFFKLGKTLQTSYITLPSEGIFHKYYGGAEEFVLRDTPFVVLGSDEREEMITFVHPTNRKMSEAYINQDALLVASTKEWSAPTGKIIKADPSILFYGELKDTQSIKTLQNIKFT
ncbi:GNAT family N-acetyltransferase [Rossellomorea vietnamensis]|uniref:GNAT family N-acetyltransferase n=1 Tax=Rossellomorea vietnamensis TaxID=218284 RepID=A0A6I6UFD8_9BACI|nr:GNAT family N-acetyltransferase [Rossellomorea vietnamensis]QHE61584.1 GNAT family N-acetyltransferase [Rossellomorea vietnamensis]